MSCPKCGKKLQTVQTLSGGSGLLRQDGGGRAVMISGVSCWNCGYWKDDVIAPAMSVADIKAAEPKQAWSPVEKTSTHYIVVKFFDSIAVQRASGVSWNTVVRLLVQGGNRCTEKTLQKHFEHEQAKRCGNDGTTA